MKFTKKKQQERRAHASLAAANSFDHGNISSRVDSVLQVIGERALNLYTLPLIDKICTYLYLKQSKLRFVSQRTKRYYSTPTGCWLKFI